MSDGTNLGIDADRALRSILAGEPAPTEDEQQTPEQVRARIGEAFPNSYSGATDCMTRAVLRLFEEREETQVWPTAREYAWTLPDGTRLTDEAARERGCWSRGSFPDDPETGATYTAYGPDLFAAVKAIASDVELDALNGCTGFMWGFAVNQARWLLGQHPGSNPALIVVDTPDGGE